ncbi:uncharacterized protein [Haliotis cracherodii]|uniref:uncharacterized protein n=1 Tax=Haliotis cracherodii TaxID=6455 RepID=UPI0039EA92A9
MSGVTATAAVLCMLAAVCVGQNDFRDWFLAIPGNCTHFTLSIGSFRRDFPCPNERVFSPVSKTCVDQDDIRNTQCPIVQTDSDIIRLCERCRAEGNGRACLFASPTNCATYINCSKTVDDDIYDNMPAYAGECEYPSYFNGVTGGCDDFTRVSCGGKEEPREPCQYARNLCGRSAHCKPCVYRYASCANKPDGVQPWEGRSWTPYFAECKNQRTLYSGSCASSRSGQPRIFSVETNRCDDLAQIPRQYGGLNEGK